MTSLLRVVAEYGTARRAVRELKRHDIAGKTGTSNDSQDAWFCGFAGSTAAVGWMGYDTPKPLGSRETGGGLVLPIWIDYMRIALKNEPETLRVQPDSVVERDGLYFYRDPVQGGPGRVWDDTRYCSTGLSPRPDLLKTCGASAPIGRTPREFEAFCFFCTAQYWPPRYNESMFQWANSASTA